MKKIILLTLLVVSILTVVVFAQKKTDSFEKRWARVEALADKQLPESALKEVNDILKQAKADKNEEQVIKAMVYKMRFTLDKDPDKMPEQIREFENFTSRSTNLAEQALLHSMTAEMYLQYYNRDAWKVNNRLEIEGKTPGDMKEWTQNMFENKIFEHLDASLANAGVLQKTGSGKFPAIITKGRDAQCIEPTLYDFLGHRKLEMLGAFAGNALNRAIASKRKYLSDSTCLSGIEEFLRMKSDTAAEKVENEILRTYQQLLTFRTKENNPEALIYLNLDRLEYFRIQSAVGNADSLYLNSLQNFEKKYHTSEFSVEILARIAEWNQTKANAWNEKQKGLYLRKAYDICEDGIKRFPRYKRVGLLENMRDEISRPTLRINYKKVAPQSKELKVKITSKNTSSLQLKVYRVNATAPEYYMYRQVNDSDYNDRTLVESRPIEVKSDVNFGEVSTETVIQPKEYGIYEFSFEKTDGKKTFKVDGGFVISDLAFINRTNETSIMRLYVLDRQSGQPLQGVQVDIFSRHFEGQKYRLDSVARFFTKRYEACACPRKALSSEEIYFFKNGQDAYFSSNISDYFRHYTSQEDTNIEFRFFTDRSIYRPGQTLHFKGIAYRADKYKQSVEANRDFEVTLYDANNKKVSSKKFKTNEFGSLAGEFVLPEGLMNGDFSLQTTTGYQRFRVEEYKRPTFEVKINRPQGEVRLGEKLTVIGEVKAYAGYSIPDAVVKYKVVRSRHILCWWMKGSEETILTGTTRSKADGTFEVVFTPQLQNDQPEFRQAYTYAVHADVTDPKGETQRGWRYLSVGNQSVFIVVDVPEKINKDDLSAIKISTQTINMQEVSSNVKYKLYRLAGRDEYAEDLNSSTEYKTEALVSSGTSATVNKQLQLDLKSQTSGRYKLVLTTPDNNGTEVKVEKIFVLYGPDDTRPPVKSFVWMDGEADPRCKVGETAHIRFGTSTKNTSVLYEVMLGDTVLESRWVTFSDEIKTFDVPFKESYGAGVNVLFTFMKDERMFTKTVALHRKRELKELYPKVSVFWDKLLPGEKATWTITIPKLASMKKTAEVLVDMYDASLDVFQSHSLWFYPVYNPSVLYSRQWSSCPFNESVDYNASDSPQKEIYQYELNSLKWYGFYINQHYRNIVGRNMRMRGKDIAEIKTKVIQVPEKSARATESNQTTGGLSIGRLSLSEKVIEPRTPAEGENSSLSQASVQPRTNFNETAFFYPQLRTDPNGEVKFSFTAPESLTRWSVKMLAHTKDLYFGQFDTTAVTQKDLMVQMNLPRFVRRSDKLTLSANVVNLTDQPLTANVDFEMIDPATEKSIKLKDSAPKMVTLTANETKAVEWELTEFSLYDLVTCKVVARAGNFSDGEQKYLPVLPDKVLITESLPLTVRNGQTRTFSFDNLKKLASTVDTKNLSVEFSSNPAWYAVQALPTIAEPRSDDAFSLFTAFYANTLATHIANASPKLKAMFERWKKEGGSRETLLSNLQKNQELKNILLEETPWVTAAQNESEQKQQIALLFDQNNQNNKSQQYWEKLLKLQVPSGGFSWFPQMPADRYITQAILYRFACLYRLTGENLKTTYQLPVKSALHYLDLEIARDFIELKKYNSNYLKENCTGNMQLFYLLMRSEYSAYPVDESAREAVKYYTSQSEQYWTDCTLYGKAMMAVLAKRNGNMELAAAILQSLKENALKTDEMGMYWTRNTSGYFWNERPIAVQAAILEAFRELQASTADLDELKIWLLRQKQTQSWDSPMATVDAIYALLKNGSDWLSNENKVQIKVGSMVLKPESTEAGTGYFKQIIPVANVKPSMGTVTVSSAKQEGGSIGWGAMYWQYFREQDQVDAQGTALRVTKSLFVKSANSKADVMVPIAQAHLKKGDRIVTRLVVTTDRNLEYVALRDQRAACFEPVNQFSGYMWREGVGYYQTSKDASTQFFFSFLPKGTYVFEYELWVNNAGTFTSGITTLQCLYAPEFVGHSGGEKLVINNI